MLSELIKSFVNVFMIPETKLDKISLRVNSLQIATKIHPSSLTEMEMIVELFVIYP